MKRIEKKKNLHYQKSLSVEKILKNSRSALPFEDSSIIINNNNNKHFHL